MKSLVSGALLALALAAGVAMAQTTPKSPPSAKAPDPAVDTKFKSADKNSNGVLEGAEASAYRSKMKQIDTDKDGKVSRDEFAAASRAGYIR